LKATFGEHVFIFAQNEDLYAQLAAWKKKSVLIFANTKTV